MTLQQITIRRTADAGTISIDPILKSLRREFGDTLDEFESLKITHAESSSLLASSEGPGILLVIAFNDDLQTQASNSIKIMEHLQNHPLAKTIDFKNSKFLKPPFDDDQRTAS